MAKRFSAFFDTDLSPQKSNHKAVVFGNTPQAKAQ
jgi:Zn/Cd-binding protein ZinT